MKVTNFSFRTKLHSAETVVLPCMRKVLAVTGACIIVLNAFAQDHLARSDFFFALPNTTKLFVAEDSTAKNISLTLTFNCGSFLEDSEFDGLSFLFEKIFAEKLRKQLHGSVAGFATDKGFLAVQSATSFEYVMFSLELPAAHFTAALQALRNSMQQPIDSVEVQTAVIQSNAQCQRCDTRPVQKLRFLIGEALWGTNFSKREYILEWNDTSAKQLQARLEQMRQQYFCAGNNLLLIKGNVRGKEVYETVKGIFSNMPRCTINLIGRYPGYGYKTLLTSRQVILEDSSITVPFFEVAFHGPTPFEGVKNNYCALLLATLLELPNSAVHHYLKDSCMLTAFSIHDDKSRNLNQLSFLLTPDTACAADSWLCFRKFLLNQIDSLIDSAQLSIAKETLIHAFREMKKNNNEHLLFVGRYWNSLGINNYSNFEDTVRVISGDDMRHFFSHFLQNNKFIAGLGINPALRKESGIDSVSTPTAASITDYEFHFLKNSAKFTSAAGDSVFNSLVQFLKLNPEIKIKVNGICHQSELLDVSDEAMLQWVRSQDYFMMNPPSLVQKKKFRLDVYRSLTLIKKLTEAGIPLARMFGTGNLVRSPEEPERHQSANCSLMF